jgi:predicted MPP superfamily phosphohydrolase
MWFVTILTILMLMADLWWWRHLDRRAVASGLSRGWRVAIASFAGLMALSVVLLLVARVFQIHAVLLRPEAFAIAVFIWHLIALPVIVVPSMAVAAIRWLTGAVRSRRPDVQVISPPVIESPAGGVPNLSRRDFLTQALIAVPPIATLALTGKVLSERDDVRIRNIRLPFKDLPRQLEGTRIAFVSDPHVGSFMSDAKYKRIIDLTNGLDADLVLHGGDLINSSLLDLPDGIQMMRGFQARYGVLSCQGNHDCLQSRKTFEADTVRAGIDMLLDESPIVRVNGVPIQIMAPRWAGRMDGSINDSVNKLLPQRRSDAWTVLLSHHPHAFDAAAAAGIPLTLAGHTHGGQLALSHNIGFGPLIYRYWSGEYFKGSSAAVVSNGVGNWFPFRLNVPCEIVHIELARA